MHGRSHVLDTGDSITVGALSSNNAVTSFSWLTAEDYVDGGHPNAGHAKIADRLTPVLARHLGRP